MTTKHVDLSTVDQVLVNADSSHGESRLYIFEDNEAVIKIIIKGRSPTMRHVSRTHRVALDWLFDGINSDPKIQIKYVDIKNQMAVLLTKGSFTRDEWNNLLHLFNIMHLFDILSQPFLSVKQKAECYDVEKISRRSFGRFAVGEGEVKSDASCVVSKPVYCEAEFSKYE